MYRIDTPNAAAVKPAYSAVGTQGYFQDTAPGGSTDLSADFFNTLQEEIGLAIEEFGGTLDKADDGQLAAVLAERISALLCDASDTGSVSTAHKRAVLASTLGQASGVNSAVVASSSSKASGAISATVACDDVDVTGGTSAALACEDGTVSGIKSALACSDAGTYDLADNYTLAGASGGSVKWALHSDSGRAELAGTLAVAGGGVTSGVLLESSGRLTVYENAIIGGFVSAVGNISAVGNVKAGEDRAFKVHTATGVGTNTTPVTFTNGDGDIVTVIGGIITDISTP